jgi:hypothetical protein
MLLRKSAAVRDRGHLKNVALQQPILSILEVRKRCNRQKAFAGYFLRKVTGRIVLEVTFDPKK